MMHGGSQGYFSGDAGNKIKGLVEEPCHVRLMWSYCQDCVCVFDELSIIYLFLWETHMYILHDCIVLFKQLCMYRYIPGILVWWVCTIAEIAKSYQLAFEKWNAEAKVSRNDFRSTSLDAMSLLGRPQWWCTAHLHLWRICLNGTTCTNHVYTYRTETKNVEQKHFPTLLKLEGFSLLPEPQM